MYTVPMHCIYTYIFFKEAGVEFQLNLKAQRSFNKSKCADEIITKQMLGIGYVCTSQPILREKKKSG